MFGPYRERDLACRPRLLPFALLIMISGLSATGALVTVAPALRAPRMISDPGGSVDGSATVASLPSTSEMPTPAADASMADVGELESIASPMSTII